MKGSCVITASILSNITLTAAETTLYGKYYVHSY